MHYEQCKHRVYDPRHNSRVTQQLCASVIWRRSSNSRVCCLNEKTLSLNLQFQVSQLKKTSWGTSHGTTTVFNRVWSMSAEPRLTSINYSGKHKPHSLWSFQTTLNCNKKPIGLAPHAVCCVHSIKRAHFVLKSIFRKSLWTITQGWAAFCSIITSPNLAI